MPEGSPELVSLSHRRVTAGGTINLAVRLIAIALGIGTAAILARALGPTSYGYLGLALTLAAIAVGVGDFGLTQVAVRESAAHPEARSRVVGALVVLRIALSLALSGMTILIGVLLLPDQADAMVVLVGIALPIGAIAIVQVVSHARFRLDLTALVLSVQSLVWFVGVAIAASQEAPLTAYGLGFLVASTAQAVAAVLAARRLSSVSFSRSCGEVRRLVGHAWPLGIAGLFVTCYYRLDSVLLFTLEGSEDAAYYLAAYRLLDVLQVLPAVVVGLLLPYLAAGSARRAGVTDRLAIRSALELLAVVAIPAVVGGMVLARPIISFLYGPEFDSSAPLLAILLPAFLSICAGWVFATALIVQGRVRAYALVAGVAAAANLAANLMLIPILGAYGAAVVTVATEFLVSTSILLVATDRRVVEYLPLGRWMRVLAAAGVMACVGWFLREVDLAAALLACLVTYVLAGFAFGGLRRRDFELLLRREEFVRG